MNVGCILDLNGQVRSFLCVLINLLINIDKSTVILNIKYKIPLSFDREMTYTYSASPFVSGHFK